MSLLGTIVALSYLSRDYALRILARILCLIQTISCNGLVFV